jgi:predicted RNase H-like HicB family nuclease
MITLTMVYWKSEQFWIGTLLEHPDVMTQGVTVEDLEEHLRDAYRLLVLDDVPADAEVKALVV